MENKEPETTGEAEKKLASSVTDLQDAHFSTEDVAVKMDEFDKILASTGEAIPSLLDKDLHELAGDVTTLVEFCKKLRTNFENEQTSNTALRLEVEDTNKKINETLKISLSSAATIEMLKGSLKSAWLEADAARLREQTTQDQMKELLEKVAILEKQTRKSKKDDTLSESEPLAKKKETILRERDRLQAEVDELQRRLEMQRLYAESLESKRQEVEKNAETLVKELENVDVDKMKIQRKVEDLTESVQTTKEENLTLKDKLSNLENNLLKSKKMYTDKITEFQLMKSSFEQMKLERSTWNRHLIKAVNELRNALKENSSMKESIRLFTNKLKDKDIQISDINKSCKKATNDYEALASKLCSVSASKTSLEEELAKIRKDVQIIERERLSDLKKLDGVLREKEVITHERDKLRGSISKLQKSKKELEYEISELTESITLLKKEIFSKNVVADEIKQSLSFIDKERTRHEQEIQVLTDKIDDMRGDIQAKTRRLTDLKLEMTNNRNNYIRMKEMYETADFKRSTLTKMLQNSNEEKETLKRRLGTIDNQIILAHKEVSLCQVKINAQHGEIEKLAKEKQEKQTEIQTLTNRVRATKKNLIALKSENQRLMQTLLVDEKQLKKQSKKLDTILHEKNLIGSQMVRRNDEIALLREKNDILHLALARGEKQYNNRLDDISILKLEIKRLKTQVNVLSSGITKKVDMRKEIVQLNRALLEERVKGQAMREEAISCVNIHRWRRLKGSDPDRMQLLTKVMVLERRIIRLYVSSVRREKQLQDAHKLYLLLKDVMDKLPSYKTKEDLLQSQRVLRMRSRKLRALAAELNTKAVENDEKDCTIEVLKSALVVAEKKLAEGHVCCCMEENIEEEEFEVEQEEEEDIFISDELSFEKSLCDQIITTEIRLPCRNGSVS